MVAEFLERHASKLKAYHSVKLNTDALVKHFGIACSRRSLRS